MSLNVTDPSVFQLPNSIHYLPVFVYFQQKFLNVDFIHIVHSVHSSLHRHFRTFQSLSVDLPYAVDMNASINICCSGIFGSGVCIFSKHVIYDTFHHRFTLNGFAHKIFHSDWFCGKSVGLAKIQIGELRVNLYGAHVCVNQTFWLNSFAYLPYFHTRG